MQKSKTDMGRCSEKLVGRDRRSRGTQVKDLLPREQTNQRAYEFDPTQKNTHLS